MPTPKNKSVLNAFAVLSAFRATDGWVSSGKLSRRANIPEAFREAPMRLRFNYSRGADQYRMPPHHDRHALFKRFDLPAPVARTASWPSALHKASRRRKFDALPSMRAQKAPVARLEWR